jgi:hypothetical protein
VEALERTVLAGFLAAREADRTQHVEETRMHLQAVRQIVRILHAGRGSLGWSS